MEETEIARRASCLQYDRELFSTFPSAVSVLNYVYWTP
jgi:hypothetical protein